MQWIISNIIVPIEVIGGTYLFVKFCDILLGR